VILFVALIAMVVLSLAGVALVRTVDTSLGVAGNLAFRNISSGPVNHAIEESIKMIFKTKPSPVAPFNVDVPGLHYFASLKPGESRNGIPATLVGDYIAMSAAYTLAGLPAPYVDATSGTELRWVIERICNFPASTNDEIIGHCDILPPKVPKAGTDNEYKPIPLPPIPIYRVTVRADVQNTNAVSYAQAFLR